ncbi:MAG: hypothetical protein NWE89_14540, partial [Candidatus Bathyarchaeota archaeon]|nr:hypothetical protein [Candidatus Bathyarchaeota archaeon]
MPICPGCGKTVAEEGINCRECIIKTREKAASEPDDFDALFDSLEKKIPKAEHDQDEIDAMTHLVENTLMGNLRKSILKNSSSGVDYQEAIAED